MQQGQDFLNHAWQPFTDGRFFEYGTPDMAHAAALAACLRELPLRVGLAALTRQAARLRGLLAAGLDPARFQPVRFPGADGPIQSWVVAQPEAVARRAGAEGVTVTVRGGYLRTAPHGYQTEADMARAVEGLNRAAQGCE